MYNKKIDAGANSENTIGNNNNNNNTSYHIGSANFEMMVPGTKEIRESEIYKICCIIAGSPLQIKNQIDVSRNADWLKKMHFNDLKKYQEKFEIYMPYYNVVESVLSSSEVDGEAVLRNIKSLYIDAKYLEPLPSSDKIIDTVLLQLNNIVRESVLHLTLTLESLNDSLHLVIFYAFTFCQILEIPPDEYEFSF